MKKRWRGKNVAKLPYFKFFPADFEMDDKVMVMDFAHIGLYLRCLNAQWFDGSIPADINALARRLKANASAVKRYWPLVAPCFIPNGDSGRLINKRLAREREEALARSEQAASAANSRYGRSSSADADAMQPHQDTRMNLFSSESESEEQKKMTALEIAVLEFSERIHRRHPEVRRCGIGEVQDKLRTIVRKVPRADKLNTLKYIDLQHEAWCATEAWTKEGGQYAKGLDNWLAPTKRRWEVPAPVPAEDTW